MTGALYLSEPFAQHALLASALVAIMCGLVSPFVVTRGMAVVLVVESVSWYLGLLQAALARVVVEGHN